MTTDMPKQIWAKEPTRKDGGMYWLGEKKNLTSYTLTSELDAYKRVAGMMIEALRSIQENIGPKYSEWGFDLSDSGEKKMNKCYEIVNQILKHVENLEAREALSEFAKLEEGV